MILIGASYECECSRKCNVAILSESSSNYGWITYILFIVLHGNLQCELHQPPRQVHITQNKMSTSSPFTACMVGKVLQIDSNVT